MKRSVLIGLAFFLVSCTPWVQCNAASGQLTGQELAQKVFDRDRGKNAEATAQMVLINKNGTKRVRHLITKRLETSGLERQLIRFTVPAEIEGTGFLTVEKPGWKTEQFLYLPALKRTRRIVSSQKSQRFVNSDFTYEDLERHPVDRYTHKLTGSENFNSLDCHVLESSPKPGTQSQYSRTISLIARNALVPVQVKYYDKKGNHIKTYTVLKLEKIQGFWTEMITAMEDHERDHKTYLKQEKVTYNTAIKTADLSREALKTY